MTLECVLYLPGNSPYRSLQLVHHTVTHQHVSEYYRVYPPKPGEFRWSRPVIYVLTEALQARREITERRP